LDLRDGVYFVTLAALFLVFAYFVLQSRKLTAHGPSVQRLRLGTVLLAAAVVVVNLFGGNIGGRLDLTPGRAYTLSPTTRQVLRRGVSARVRHPRAHASRAAGDRVRGNRGRGLGPEPTRLHRAARPARTQLHGPVVSAHGHRDPATGQGDRRRGHARVVEQRR